MSGFQHVVAFVADTPWNQRDGWPHCYYVQERFCGQDAVICECPSCPVKCQADAAAYQAQKRVAASSAAGAVPGETQR